MTTQDINTGTSAPPPEAPAGNESQPRPSSYRLVAPPEQFKLALTLGGNLPKTVSGQPATYFWKDVIAAGSYQHPAGKFSLAVDQQRLQRWAQTGRKMLSAGVAVPINCDHSDSARDCVGYVKDFKVEADRLLALCQFIGKDAEVLAARNQVSAGIVSDFTDGRGRKWGEAIVHLALTPVPLVTGQEAFAAAASAGGQDVLMLAAVQEKNNDLMLPCSPDCLDRLHECVPGLNLTAAGQKLPKIAEHLAATMLQLSQNQQKLSSAEQAGAAAAAPPALDGQAMGTAIELLNTKLDIALSRGAIDAATRQRLGQLLIRRDSPAAHTLLLWRADAGDRPLALAIAEILIDNLPLANGETTALQALSRAVPGEADSSDLGPFAQHMKQVANRR